ncbi:Vacuolar protein sorting/targeting protein PEP1 [Saccharomyces cerevisiae]|nr:Vacuolar protein sorting/targeting protein PEP1 [Saccharomyces cerevisiae]
MLGNAVHSGLAGSFFKNPSNGDICCMLNDLHENANELSSFTSQGGNFEIEQEDAHTSERNTCHR